jgi:DNA end-binding protein Ku
VVSRDDAARGYEVGKGQYLIVEDEELDAVQVESTRTIEIDQFVPRSEIDDRYIDSPYYIAPDGQVGQDAFAVIRDTIGKLNMVALGRVVLTRREHVIALEPRGRGFWVLLSGIPTRFGTKRHTSRTSMSLPKEMLDLATHIVDTRSGHFDPSKFEDRYENALIDPLLECSGRRPSNAHSRGAVAEPTGNRYDAIADCTGSISDATSASACEPLTTFDTGRAW